MARWTEKHIPDQSGRIAVVTGANGGLGAETVRALATRGAHVVMACRTLSKGEAIAAPLMASGASVEVVALDLADLRSVRACVTDLRQRHPSIDLLILNAGIMAIPRRTTAQGHEMQLGTNHIGHFAFCAGLLGQVTDRVVTVSSQAHRTSGIRWADPMSERRYNKWQAYGQSKLANLLFAFELDRRLQAAGSTIRSLAAHPGYANTNLQHVGPQMADAAMEGSMMRLGNGIIAQSAAMGALPTLRAAVDPDAASGDYFGPDGFAEFRGWPVRVKANGRARSAQDAQRFWTVTEGWVGGAFDVAAAVTGVAPTSTFAVVEDVAGSPSPDEVDSNAGVMEPEQMEPEQMEPEQMEPQQMEPQQMEPQQMEPEQMKPAQMEPADDGHQD